MNTAQIKPRLYPALQRICVDRPNLGKQIGSVKPGFRRHRLATQIPRRGDHSRDRKYLIQLSIRLAGGLGFEPRLAESESDNSCRQEPSQALCRHQHPQTTLLFVRQNPT
jgi:hypothetical protein